MVSTKSRVAVNSYWSRWGLMGWRILVKVSLTYIALKIYLSRCVVNIERTHISVWKLCTVIQNIVISFTYFWVNMVDKSINVCDLRPLMIWRVYMICNCNCHRSRQSQFPWCSLFIAQCLYYVCVCAASTNEVYNTLWGRFQYNEGKYKKHSAVESGNMA